MNDNAQNLHEAGVRMPTATAAFTWACYLMLSLWRLPWQASYPCSLNIFHRKCEVTLSRHRLPQVIVTCTAMQWIGGLHAQQGCCYNGGPLQVSWLLGILKEVSQVVTVCNGSNRRIHKVNLSFIFSYPGTTQEPSGRVAPVSTLQ